MKLLSQEQQHLLLKEFNHSFIEYPKDKTFVELFEDQVLETPCATALVFAGQSLTYKELNVHANQLAHYLRSKGVKSEALVPVCFERSLEMIVGILGVLKAGGAYVPIDPASPNERIGYMLEDTGATLLLTNNKEKLPTKQGLEIVDVNLYSSFFKDQPKYNLPIIARAGNLVYVIYTSGSTGNPKGVMIEHKALLDHCFGVISSANLKSCSSFALFSPLIFDAGHSIVFACFLLGATLHVLSLQLLLNGRNLAAYVHENLIDCLKIVPSLWLSYANKTNVILSEKVMIFGGDSFTNDVLDVLLKSDYDGNVYNHYGPTETTIGKCIHKVDLRNSYDIVPIGKPFSNTQIYIVDKMLKLVPIGEVGEILIGGDGLARGYLKRPELTAEKFIDNPFSSRKEDKLYKTGDYGRWRGDGDIEYLGRIDEQVKIRGYRIELGEIESTLQQCKLIKQAVIIGRADKSGHQSLVGYVVSNEVFDPKGIVSYLTEKLPEYMIPTSWVSIESIPLTFNGKIDRKALRDMNVAESISNQYIAPRNEIELNLAEIWKDLLGLQRVGVDDNFFELGGDSIITMQLQSRIKEIGYNYHQRDILVYQTIEKLAEKIQQLTMEDVSGDHLKSVSNKGDCLIPIQTLGLRIPFFVIGNFWYYKRLAKYLSINQPLYCLEGSVLEAHEDIASQYIKEIKLIQPRAPYYLGAFCGSGKILLQMVRQLESSGEQVAVLALFEMYSPEGIRQKLSLKYLKLYFAKMLKTSFFKSGEFKRGLKQAVKTLRPQKDSNIKGTKGEKYACNVALFKASSPDIWAKKDPYMGWSNYFTGEMKTYTIQGSHESIFEEPGVICIAEYLEQILVLQSLNNKT